MINSFSALNGNRPFFKTDRATLCKEGRQLFLEVILSGRPNGIKLNNGNSLKELFFSSERKFYCNNDNVKHLIKAILYHCTNDSVITYADDNNFIEYILVDGELTSIPNTPELLGSFYKSTDTFTYTFNKTRLSDEDLENIRLECEVAGETNRLIRFEYRTNMGDLEYLSPNYDSTLKDINAISIITHGGRDVIDLYKEYYFNYIMNPDCNMSHNRSRIWY